MSLGYQRQGAVGSESYRSVTDPLLGKPPPGGIGNAALLDRIRDQGPVGLGGQPMIRRPTELNGEVRVAEAGGTMNAARQAPAALERTPFDAVGLEAVSAAVYAVVPAEYQGDQARSGVRAVLHECAEAGVRNPSQVAYLLATTEHESRFGKGLYSRSEPLVEDHNPFSASSHLNRKTHKTTTTWSATVHTNDRRVTGSSEDELETNYWDSAYGGRLGNARGTEDARSFRGRGFVQVTGRDNFRRISALLNAEQFSYTLDGSTWGGDGNRAIDLEANPDHANRSLALAARIEVKGMLEGAFTGMKLGEAIAATPGEATREQYTDARAVVNGDGAKNGGTIADIALRYAKVLNADEAWSRVLSPRRQPIT